MDVVAVAVAEIDVVVRAAEVDVRVWVADRLLVVCVLVRVAVRVVAVRVWVRVCVVVFRATKAGFGVVVLVRVDVRLVVTGRRKISQQSSVLQGQAKPTGPPRDNQIGRRSCESSYARNGVQQDRGRRNKGRDSVIVDLDTSRHPPGRVPDKKRQPFGRPASDRYFPTREEMGGVGSAAIRRRQIRAGQDPPPLARRG